VKEKFGRHLPHRKSNPILPIRMHFTDFMIHEDVSVDTIAGIYPKNQLTLIHGIQGSGKSYSCIKSLNEVGIAPIYIAVEESYGLAALDKYITSKHLLFKMIAGERIDGLEGSVVVIDTYTRMHTTLIDMGYTDETILYLLEEIINRYSITLIVIGHTRNFASRGGIFEDNQFLPRGCSEELFLEKNEHNAKKATKSSPAVKPSVTYSLHVNKGRGSGGARIIPDWCRSNASSSVSEEVLTHIEDSVKNIDESNIPTVQALLIQDINIDEFISLQKEDRLSIINRYDIPKIPKRGLVNRIKAEKPDEEIIKFIETILKLKDR